MYSFSLASQVHKTSVAPDSPLQNLCGEVDCPSVSRSAELEMLDRFVYYSFCFETTLSDSTREHLNDIKSSLDLQQTPKRCSSPRMIPKSHHTPRQRPCNLPALYHDRVGHTPSNTQLELVIAASYVSLNTPWQHCMLSQFGARVSSSLHTSCCMSDRHSA